MRKRPLAVTVLACVLLASGVVGLVYHASELRIWQPFPYGALGVELVRVLAIVCGVFLLKGRNWARWLAMGWIGFHVGISAFDSWQKVAVHLVVFAVFGYVLWRPAAQEYFGERSTA